jgi:succinoglycan biosynthesis transport protein ExoP
MTFGQFLGIVRARKGVVVAIALATVVATVALSWLMPARWSATASVLVDAKGPDPITGLVLPAQMLPGYLSTQVDIIQSQNVALKVVHALKLDESPVARQEWQADTAGRGSLRVWLADLLLKKLDVKPARDSSVIHISFSAVDPGFAATVANAFAQAYIDANLELRVEPARQSARWFSEQTRTLRQDVEGSAAKLAEYQQAKGIVSLDERLDTENARLEQLNAQLSQAAALTADGLTRQRLARDFAARGSAPDSIPEVLASPLVQSLKGELSRQEGKLKEILARLGTNHPQYQEASAEVQSIQQRLKDEMAGVVQGIENNYRIAQRREAELREQLNAQKDKVLALKRERDTLAALIREAENAQKAFDLTTQRRTQTSLESLATQTNIVVLNPAVEPITPAFPKWPLNIALGALLGVLLGLGTALILEMLDQRIRSPSDVTGTLGLPLLARLPRAKFARRTRAPLRPRQAPS